MEPIIQRIKRIIELEKLTQASFADACDLNKSTLSHVLTGRNQPSIQVIQKILGAFPHYRYEWIVSGDLPMVSEEYRQRQAQEAQKSLFATDNNENISNSSLDISDKQQKHREGKQQTTEVIALPLRSRRTIEKIIVYYDDNTYQIFRAE